MRKTKTRKTIVARTPRALEPARPSLIRLPEDLWIIITDLLEVTSPRTVVSLGLVNSLFYCLARSSQYSHLQFDLTTEVDASIIQRCERAKATGLLSAVRQLSILDASNHSRSQAESPRKCLPPILRLLPLMTGLKGVVYRSTCLSKDTLLALEALPHVTLDTLVHVVAEPRSTPASTESNLMRLRGNVNLRSLDVKVTYFKPNDCLLVMEPLKALLLSCPNVRRLTLEVAQPSVSTTSGPSQQYCGLGFEEGDKIPPLEELVLIDYPFGHEPINDGRTIDINSGGYPVKGTEIDFWAENFDWSRLRRLQTPHGELALKLMPKLTALEVSEHRGTGDVASFHIHVPAALETVEVPTLERISLDGILRHSTSLQELRMHQTETLQPGWSDNAIDLMSLQRIQRECHRITDLSLDIARSGAWPYAVFDVLASFANLKRLELWFELGSSDAENPVKPYVTSSAAEHIFGYLRSHGPTNHSSLQRLVLHSGPSSSPASPAFRLPGAYWPLYNSTSFVCQLSERDDEAAAGVFRVDCPSLSAEKRRLRAIKSGPERIDTSSHAPRAKAGLPGSRAFVKIREALGVRTMNATSRDKTFEVGKPQSSASSEAERVAREGPIRMSQWCAHY